MNKYTTLSIMALSIILVVCLTLNYCDSHTDSLSLVTEIHYALDSIAAINQDKIIGEVGSNAEKAFGAIIQSYNERTYLLFGIWGFSSLILIIFFNKSPKKKNVPQHFTDLDNEEQVVHLGNVCYDSSSCMFCINNKIVKVRPLCAELLLYLINSSHHYANKKEICIHLWKTDEIDTSDRLRRLICDLRKLLEINNANIMIEAVINGYQLNVKEEI